MITKKVTKTVAVDLTIYIAEDGTEFNDFYQCDMHEKNLLREKQLEALKSMEYKECMDDVIPLDGREHYESYDYRWYRPKNIEEIELLNDFFKVEDSDTLTEVDIGDWICFENCDISRCDADSTYISLLSDCVRQIKWFLEQFGYKISINQDEKKG